MNTWFQAKKSSKLKVSIGIPVYNAERNIEKLVDSLLMQKANTYFLEKIIIHSDSSTDNTISIIQKYKNEKIQLIDAKKRKGFAQGVKILLSSNISDIMVLLNDDIVIEDTFFIEKTLRPFSQNSHVGLVCSNPQPFKPDSFIEKAVVSGFRAYEQIKLQVNRGDTVLTCDGKTMTLSKSFIQRLKFPEKLEEMGNVDGYIYFSCLKNGFVYKFAKDAIVYFKCPSTVKDFTKWTIRNNITRSIFQRTFGDVVVKDYNVPFSLFLYYRFIEFFKNPLGCTFLLLTGVYCSVKANLSTSEFNTTWDLVDTTKDLKYL